MNTTEKPEYVRRRHNHQGSVLRPRKLEIRMTPEVSNRLASIQGLLLKYGRKELMCELWENVCMPALAEYVKPYAEKARAEREAMMNATQAELNLN